MYRKIILPGILFLALVWSGHILLQGGSHAAERSEPSRLSVKTTRVPLAPEPPPPAASAEARATPKPVPPSTASPTEALQPAAGETTAPRRATIEVQHQRVSLHVRQMRLRSILRRIAAKTDISFTYFADTSTALTTLDLDNVTVEEAMKHVLAEFDAVFFYRGAGTAKTSELQSVWIYPPGQGLTALRGETGESIVADAILHPDPGERALAYENLLQRPELLSSEILRDGLLDAATEVRLRVLSQALMAHVVLPADALERLALVDAEVQVRLAALAAMSSHPEIDIGTLETIARQASHDSDPAVQSQAMELLGHLEAVQAGETVDELAWQTLETDETVAPGQMAVPAHEVSH